MKTICSIFARLLPLILAFSGASAAAAKDTPEPQLELTFFGSRTCAECLEIKQNLLSPIEAQSAPLLKINYRDTEDTNDFRLLCAMEKDYGVTNPSPQELFFPDTVLCGYADITKQGRQLVEFYLARPEKWISPHVYTNGAADRVQTAEALQERVSKFTMVGLFAAGFVDGINPCAIATMIFLISFLGTQHRKRSEVLTIGLTFTATVFVTYLSLGLGAFKILSMMTQYYWLSLAIRGTAVTLAVIVALMNIWDAVKFYRTHDTTKMTVQLPKGIKLLIHSVIRGHITNRQIVIGAIITGFVVTLLEGACTAKIYLPTIVLMTHQFGFRSLGWMLLLFYNFLFVLPLLCVMIASAYGLKWGKLSKFTQDHLVLVKVLLALVLFALAAFISVGK